MNQINTIQDISKQLKIILLLFDRLRYNTNEEIKKNWKVFLKEIETKSNTIIKLYNEQFMIWKIKKDLKRII